LLAGLAVWQISHLRFELDLYDILDPSLKSSQNQWTMRQEFNDTNSVFVSLYSNETLTAEQVCKLKNFSSNYINESQEVERITSPWSLRHPVQEGDRLWYRPYLQDPCELEANKPISAAWQSLRQTPWSFFFNGNNENQISMDVAFKEQKDSNGKVKFDVIVIDHFAAALDQFIKTELPQLKYHIFGHVSLRWHIMHTLKKDFIWNIAILVFFAVFFYFFLGTWRAGFYYILCLLFADVMLLGCMSLLDFPIDLMSNCLILMMAVSGVSDFLFVSSAQREGEDWQKSFIEVVTPSFFTSFTTVMGFASLGFSTIPAISRFGYSAAMGAFFEWVATFLLLPALLTIFRVKKSWVREGKGLQMKAAWFLKLNRFAPGRILTAMMLVLGCIGAMGLSHLNIGDNILQNFAKGHPVRDAYEWLKTDKVWQGQVFLLFNPEISTSEMSRKLEQIRHLDGLAHVEDPQEIENFYTQSLEPSFQSLVAREISIGPMKHYRSLHHYTRVPLYTNSLDLAVLRKVMTNTESICQGECFLAGQTVVYLEYSDRISQSLVDSLSASIITVAFLLFALAYIQKSPHALALTISSIWAPFVMMGFLWWWQVPVTSVTSIFFALIVGWTGDNAIQYMFANEDILQGAEERASATLMQTLLFVGSSLFFTMHTFVPAKILGMLFVIGFSITYMGDLWLLKGLLSFRWRASKEK
jgi:predicted RND superfamily exporter protein